MRYYKRLQSSNGFKKDIIYTSEEILNKVPAFRVNPAFDGNDLWQDALEIDYLLQVAKEKYKVGTVFKTMPSFVKDQVSVTSDGCIKVGMSTFIGCYVEEESHIEGSYIIYNGNTKQWAKIVEEKKTITDYENDTMMDKPMTHQEAIEILQELKEDGSIVSTEKEALDLAIKNMEENKPKVLDPQEWANKKNGLTFSELYYEYTQYLNDNK